MNNNSDFQVEEVKEKKGCKGLLTAILIFCILTFISSAALLTDVLIVQTSVINAVSDFAKINSSDERAKEQGNLGNYNVKAVKSRVIKVNNDYSELSLELEFTNYGKHGKSFNEVITPTAYQEDKEIKQIAYDIIEIEDKSKDEKADNNEADIKVKNGKSTTVILTYQLNKVDTDASVELSTDSKTFTYTVNLDNS